MSQRQQGIGGGVADGNAAYHVFQSVSSGTRDRVTVGEVAEGGSFIATALSVSTVQDPGGDFDVALFNGQEQVSPIDTTATMATDELALPAGSEYDSGSEITVELDARDRSADIDVTVVVAGFRDPPGE
jgi:hypothetical protein